MIMSPPASRKSIARVPAGMELTALAETREVLDCRGDVDLLHARDEGRDVRRHNGGLGAELPLQLSDRSILVFGASRYDVSDRGEVEVDAADPQLASPALGLRLELGWAHRPLSDRGRDDVEPWAGEALDPAALLIGGDEEPHAAGRLMRPELLDVIG